MTPSPSDSPPAQLVHVQMEAESGCSRCNRLIPLLGFAFMDENYAAVCGACAADAYNTLRWGDSPADFLENPGR